MGTFLKKLWTASRRRSRGDRPASVSEPQFVRPDGDIARFVFDRRHLFKDGKPKRGAFQLDWHPGLNRFEVSVCGLAGVELARVWGLGGTIRAAEGKSAIAALRLPVASVTSLGLDCGPAPELPDFPEHGVITGWDPADDAKDGRIALQQDLAGAVTDVMRPPAIGGPA